MRIIVRNNRNGNIENEIVKKMVRFYLTELVGSNKVDSLGSIKITFKKLIRRRGGWARTFGTDNHNYEIVVNSTWTARELYKTFAHECTHIKQYFLKELVYTSRWSKSGRRQSITNWKGRQYIRKAYAKQPWEIDAQKGEKLAYNILNKINDSPVAVVEPVKVEPVKAEPIKVEPSIRLTNVQLGILEVLKSGKMENGKLIPFILGGSKDKQYKIRVHKEVFELKQKGLIIELNLDGIVWVAII